MFQLIIICYPTKVLYLRESNSIWRKNKSSAYRDAVPWCTKILCGSSIKKLTLFFLFVFQRDGLQNKLSVDIVLSCADHDNHGILYAGSTDGSIYKFNILVIFFALTLNYISWYL